MVILMWRYHRFTGSLKNSASVILLVTLTVSGLSPLVQKAVAQSGVVGGATTSMIVSQLSDRLGDLISQAEMSGDFILAQALRNIMTLLDNFDAVAGDLLDKAFDELNEEQREFFLKTEALLSDATEGSQVILDQVASVSDQAYSIINDLPLVGKDEYTILRYEPSLVVWEPDREISLTVVGLNMGSAEPVLIIGSEAYSPVSLTNQQAVFKIPTDYVRQPFDDYTPVVATVNMHKDGWFRDEKYQFPIELRYAPRVFGKIENLQVVADQTVRERSQIYRRYFGFEGRDTTIRVTQTPVSGEGWRIDPSSIVYQKTSGKASDPLYMDGPAGPTGFTMAMQCLQYYQDLSSKAGYGTAWWTWQEVREVTSTNVTRSIGGERYISLGDSVVWPLGPDIDSVAGTFRNFRGQSSYVNGIFSSSPLAAVTLDGENLVISPRFQQDTTPRTTGSRYKPDLMEMLNEIRRQDLRNAPRFLWEVDEALVEAEAELGEELFVSTPVTPAFSGLSASNPSTYVRLKMQVENIRSLISEAESPLANRDLKHGLASHISIILASSDLQPHLERVLIWADTR